VSGLVAMAVAIAKGIQQPPPLALTTYQNPEQGIEIKYPKDWSVQPGAYPSTPDLVIFEAPKAMLTVNVEDLEKPLLLNEYTDELISGIKKNLTGFKQLDRCPTTLAISENKTITTCYAGKENGRNLSYLSAVTLQGNRAYYITYIAEPDQYQALLRPAEEMIKSFKIIDKR
jgi:eukaryotic-like serine/threonine-protein kinase